jgi:ubiquinone/menaquinone biosynthesis C-methylase UbiE
MSKNHAHHDYVPAAGVHALLPTYDLMTKLMGMHRTYDRLIAQAGLADGMRVLEIGCGTGNVLARARKAHPGVELIGSDPDPSALERARRKLPGTRLDVVYAQELPYADGEFDRVLSSAMLHHLDAATKPLALAEVFRVLRPGGHLHLVDFVGGHAGLAGGFLRKHTHAPIDFTGDIPGMLRAAGFSCESLGSQRNLIFGPLTFFRAIRPV